MEPMVKGYMIQTTSSFIVRELASTIAPDILDVARAAEANVKGTEWRPRADVVRLWRAIADAHPDDESARRALIRTGQTMSEMATSTFLKLLLKVLTPRMFAAKFPDFWTRDNTAGRGSVEIVSEKKLHITMHDVAGYDHLGPVGVGWVTFALAAIGMKDVEARCLDWSRSKPSATTVHVEASWR